MTLKDIFILIITLFFLIGCGKKESQASDTAAPVGVSAPTDPTSPTKEIVGYQFRKKYPLKSATQKLVDNYGNGYDALYGVRNFRAVLNGVYYRGGANNAYNKHGKRNNMNPLPTEGLDNLCKEGFSEAVYLYPTNYNSAPRSVTCIQGNVLDYKQTTILAGGSRIRDALDMIYSHITHQELGPIYAHCWNGWHASGFLAAITLKQFCGFNGDQAVKYWVLNTDGDGGNIVIKNMIYKFQPFSDLNITAEEKAALCPNPDTLLF